MKGIEWLQRHLGDQYKIHVMPFKNYTPMHIDGTINTIGPGLLVVNPDRPCVGNHLDIFKKAGVCNTHSYTTVTHMHMHAHTHRHYKY